MTHDSPRLASHRLTHSDPPHLAATVGAASPKPRAGTATSFAAMMAAKKSSGASSPAKPTATKKSAASFFATLKKDKK